MDGIIAIWLEAQDDVDTRECDKLQTLAENDWIKFRNLGVKTSGSGGNGGSVIRVCYQDKSSFCRFPEHSYNVQNVIRAHRTRQVLASRQVAVPGMKIVTVTPFQTVSPFTLAEIVQHATVPYKFRCLARVVRHIPAEVEALVVKEGDRTVYKLQLDLADSTGHLSALLYADDADEFFHGLPAVDLTKNNVSAILLKTKLMTILNHDTWINCCIKKYLSNGGKVCYRMFGTSIMAY